ncbi:Phospholipid scramblase 3 [Folsomia candida]|uniref:Phospholipid scramblase n=1 Tax=Folsomia candida TaxID=158441 RepID=A0A226E1I9_FOLCA|nr:Phospholipid scramblase 3 [Folsomia candida]
MSDLSLSLYFGEEEQTRTRPPAADCESIYGLLPTPFDSAFPLDAYNYGRKNKPPTSSFYDRLKDLRDANRIFVKPCIKPIIRYLDQKCQFEVLNAQGEPIYFVLDTTDAWASTIFEGQGTKPFNVMILDYDYSEVKGPPNSYATGLPNCPDFDVVLPDEVSLMGRITKQWIVFGKASDGALPEDTYSLSFHPNMDLRTKCLLLSIVFMLDYQFYHKTVQSGVSRKCWTFFILGFASLVIILYILLSEIKKNKTLHMTHKMDDFGFNVTTTQVPETSSIITLDENDVVVDNS